MTVYVDQLPASGWGAWNNGAHMLASDLDELHAMAARIGLRRAWFQERSTFAHYDLTASKRTLALQAGAVPVAAGHLPDDVLMRNPDGSYETRAARNARRTAAPAAVALHRVTSGDLFAGGAQTLVNAVNCVGVMGAGIAKAFRERYPDMDADYRARCAAGQVRLGAPYLWAPPAGDARAQVIQFPTKQHFRDRSQLEPIRAGLAVVVASHEAWGVRSLGVPALGCGLGGLAWEQVQPVLIEHLGELPVPVTVYRPR